MATNKKSVVLPSGKGPKADLTLAAQVICVGLESFLDKASKDLLQAFKNKLDDALTTAYTNKNAPVMEVKKPRI